MILSFNKENIEKRNFKEKILNGTKIHTIREDKHNRWKETMSIQFYAMNPRNGGKKFAEGIVDKVTRIEIDTSSNKVYFPEFNRDRNMCCMSNPMILDDLAKCDGFESWEEMKEFFPEYFEGKIIYWILNDRS